MSWEHNTIWLLTCVCLVFVQFVYIIMTNNRHSMFKRPDLILRIAFKGLWIILFEDEALMDLTQLSIIKQLLPSVRRCSATTMLLPSNIPNNAWLWCCMWVEHHPCRPVIHSGLLVLHRKDIFHFKVADENIPFITLHCTDFYLKPFASRVSQGWAKSRCNWKKNRIQLIKIPTGPQANPCATLVTCCFLLWLSVTVMVGRHTHNIAR